MEYIIDITYKYILYIKIREGSGINTKDQEEGGGAGLSESPRKIKSREVEVGPRLLDNPLLRLFLNSCLSF